jgi:hypothetical protein
VNHFDRRILSAMIARAPRMTDADLTALLADPEVSPAGRRVLEAEAEARTGQQATARV